MHLLMIGCGNMGGALLTAWLKNNIAKQVSIITPSGAPKFKDHNKVTAYTSVDDIASDAHFDCVMIGVKPQMIDDVLPAYKRFVNPDTVFVTMAAGKIMDAYHSILGDNVHLIRIMPNTPSALGHGVTLITANDNTTDAQLQQVCDLLNANGTIEHMRDEHELDKATTISGCGPAYVALFVENLTHAGVELGLDKNLAERLAIQTVIGSGVMLDTIDLPVAQQRQNVTSKKGVTAAALDIMMDDKNSMQDMMQKALKNALKRTHELRD